MRNKILVGLTTTVTAVTMVFAPCVTSFATDNPPISVEDGKTHDYQGDVVGLAGSDAVIASNEGTIVNIEGDVKSSGKDEASKTSYGINASDGAEVNVDGSVLVTSGGNAVSASSSETSEKTKVDITKDIDVSGTLTRTFNEGYVSQGGTAVTAENNSEVHVHGNISVADGGKAISASSDSAKVIVDGNVNVSGNGDSYDKDQDYHTVLQGVSVNAQNGATVEIGGNVTTTDAHTGLSASGEGSTITVKGSVDSSGSIIQNNPNKKETTNAVGAFVNSGGKIIVEENVSGTFMAARSGDNSTLEIGGNLTSTGGLMPSSDGTVTSGVGLYVLGDSEVTIKGNVFSINDGVDIYSDNDSTKGTIVIQGVINTSASSGTGIAVKSGHEYTDVEAFNKDMPTLIVGGINSATPVSVDYATLKDKTHEESAKILTEELTKAINYIIKIDDKYAKLSEENENVTELEGYNTVNLEKAFKVAASLPDGARLDGGQYVDVTDNGDGTFTLILKDAKGGINVTAILKPVEDESSGETEIEVVAVSETSTSSESTAETTSTTPPADAIVVATVAAPAPNAAPSPISGTKAAVNVTMDLTKVTPIQYKTAVIENITAAPAGGALNIVTDRVSVLDAKMINAIAARPDIDVNIVFTYMGKKIKVTIPAGYDVSKLLDPYGYCGFLRLLDILGGTEIK